MTEADRNGLREVIMHIRDITGRMCDYPDEQEIEFSNMCQQAGLDWKELDLRLCKIARECTMKGTRINTLRYFLPALHEMKFTHERAEGRRDIVVAHGKVLMDSKGGGAYEEWHPPEEPTELDTRTGLSAIGDILTMLDGKGKGKGRADG